MACLDTCCLIDLSGRGGARAMAAAEALVRQLLRRGDLLTTTRFNVAELWVGVERSDDPVYEETAVNNLLRRLAVLEFDETAARSFAHIKADLYNQGQPAGDMDILIASVALTEGEALVTRNIRHFTNMPDLKVITY